MPYVTPPVAGSVASASAFGIPVAQAANALQNQQKLETRPLGGTITITSTSYANLGGSSSLSFTKQLSSSSLEVEIETTAAAITSGAFYVYLGVLINGVDYDVAKLYWNNVTLHLPIVGSKLITGIAAGTFTVQVRGKNSVASRTTQWDLNDDLIVTVREVPLPV